MEKSDLLNQDIINYKNFYQEIQKSSEEFMQKQNEIIRDFFSNFNVFINFLSSFILKYLEKRQLTINFNNYLINPKITLNNNIINDFYQNFDLNRTFLSKKTLRKKENGHIKNHPKYDSKKIFRIDKIYSKKEKIVFGKKKKKYAYRGSKYRGVTRNGRSWQVLIMINRVKKYYGNYKTEEEAAKVYDELAMKYHKEKARLNFSHDGFLLYKEENNK